jgi:UDP-N-acetyl-D-glucosamine dehydrogenase
MDNFFKEFQERIRKKNIKIAVVGLGYVGLPLALEFSRVGIKVLGVEVDGYRLKQLKEKHSYITDTSDREIREAFASHRFFATGDFSAVKEADVIIICVPTPLKRKYHPDISYIKQAVKSISKNLKAAGCLIILESTTYPGTTEEVILPLLSKNNLKHNKDFYLSFSPERIDPGNKKYPVNKIPKVVGGVSPQATKLAASVYENIIDKVVPVSSSRTAEAVKLLENTFRLINIAMIDELAMMAHKMNIDIWEVIKAASTKPFGFMPFYPGPGVGGHCIPKDPLYLYWKAKHFGFRSRFIKLASDIINFMPEYVVGRVQDLLKQKKIPLKGARILVMGVTYKKDIKDLRKSPSIDIIETLQTKEAKVSYFDPIIPYLKFNRIDLESIRLKKEELKKFDCMIIATDHTDVDYCLILKYAKLIFDTRCVYRGIKDKKVVIL